MASLIMKHETPARCRASRSVKQSSGLQKDYKFKFKYLLPRIHDKACIEVHAIKCLTHTRENLTKHNITKKLS